MLSSSLIQSQTDTLPCTRISWLDCTALAQICAKLCKCRAGNSATLFQHNQNWQLLWRMQIHHMFLPSNKEQSFQCTELSRSLLQNIVDSAQVRIWQCINSAARKPSQKWAIKQCHSVFSAVRFWEQEGQLHLVLLHALTDFDHVC